MLTILDQLREEKHSEEVEDQLGEENDNSEEITYLSYTKYWIDRVNRGGLFCVNNDTHLLFLAIEYVTRSCLHPATLKPQTVKNKEEAKKKIMVDADVQFHWCHLTGDHEEVVAQELLSRLVCLWLWLNIRGFSSAAAFKHTQRITLKAKKALRKELKKAKVSLES